MREIPDVPLSSLTTLRLGGPAKRVVEVDTAAELIDLVRTADSDGEPLLILGGGSNVVIADSGFDGTVVRINLRGIQVDDSASCESDDLAACGGILITVAAGEPWDDLVARTVDEEWVGMEALSGIPGLTGATPMQNVGAYGQEVAQTLWSVRTWDRETQSLRTFANADCGFGYRSSRFKGGDRYVILEVTYQLRQGDLSAPIRYAELARKLDVRPGERARIGDVRRAVLELRTRKGMVLDPADHDTWSAGSFFTNPVLDTAATSLLPPEAPRWEQPDGRIKTSAAWLIEQAGFERGYGRGRARLSTKHTLALTNRGECTTEELLALAKEVRDGVRARFGVTLHNEPVLVGCSL